MTPEAPPTIPAAYLVQESFAEGVNWIVFALLDDADVTGVRTFPGPATRFIPQCQFDRLCF
ncbi:MAG: hypothetical protein M5U34_17595 [Chloroflexi bacterium]|nr:hypothetical protein [Chloroflexota bacterium]